MDGKDRRYFKSPCQTGRGCLVSSRLLPAACSITRLLSLISASCFTIFQSSAKVPSTTSTSTDTIMSSTKPILPTPYFYFFFLVEPILTLAGAAYAIFLPETYGRELLPCAVEIGTDAVGGSSRGRLVIGCLGNCTLYTHAHSGGVMLIRCMQVSSSSR